MSREIINYFLSSSSERASLTKAERDFLLSCAKSLSLDRIDSSIRIRIAGVDFFVTVFMLSNISYISVGVKDNL